MTPPETPRKDSSTGACDWSGLESMEPRILLSAARATQIRVLDAAGAEGSAGDPGRVVFTVRRLGDQSKRSVVKYRTIALTGNANPAMWGVDFNWVQGRLVFRPGQRVQFAVVNLIGNGADENNRLFAVRLFKAKNAKVTKPYGVGTIVDDDGALPKLSVGDIAVIEGNKARRTVFFTVSLNRVHNQTVTVNFATQDVSAVSTFNSLQNGPEDFVPASGTLTFLAGETVKSIAVEIVGDRFEATKLFEVFYLNLSNPTNATLAKAVGTGTIEDDDGKWA